MRDRILSHSLLEEETSEFELESPIKKDSTRFDHNHPNQSLPNQVRPRKSVKQGNRLLAATCCSVSAMLNTTV